MASVSSFRELIGIKPSTASTDDSALIIIDAQNEYSNGLLQTRNVSETSSAIKSLLDKYRNNDSKNGGRVVHVLHQTPEGAPVFTPGKEVAKEMQGLEPREGEKVIVKEQASSFTGTGLDDFLKERGVKKLVLCGYMAHVCVSTTARAGDELGYDIVLAADAIGDRDIPGVDGVEVTKIALLELADAFGTVVQSADIK